MKFIQDNKAFTLLQLIVVVAIILVLTAIVLSGEDAISRTGKAKDVQRYQDVTAIAKAVELYQLDNDSLPSPLATAAFGVDEKFVLCSSVATKTCNSQDKTCIVLETDFLNTYLGGALPIDPEKTDDTDTGYYVTRTSDKMTFGACENYEGNDIEYIARATVPPVCGNSIIEGGEVCDEGDAINEGCGNGIQENIGTYCNGTCTGYNTINVDEPCDYDYWSYNCRINGTDWYTVSDVGGPSYCNITCTVEISSVTICDDTPPPS